MEWYVYRHDTNKGTIYKYNVLQPYIVEQIKSKTEKLTTLSAFKEILKKEMQYYYWGKSEHEVVIKEWCGTTAEKKIDIFDQLQLNWEVFVIYVWNSLLEKEEKSKEEKNPCKDCYCKDCANAHEPLMCPGCGYCTNGEDKIEIGECCDYKKEGATEVKEVEEMDEVEATEDFCKDCQCKECANASDFIDCVGCKYCDRGSDKMATSSTKCENYVPKAILRGHQWTRDPFGSFLLQCSNCKAKPLCLKDDPYYSDYCPFCGVHMENCKGGEIV